MVMIKSSLMVTEYEVKAYNKYSCTSTDPAVRAYSLRNYAVHHIVKIASTWHHPPQQRQYIRFHWTAWPIPYFQLESD